jgi:transposase
VNEKGLPGVEEEKRSGRPSSLTTEISDKLKEVLLRPPTSQGYSQSRWDGPLVRTYLKEKHEIDIGRSQVNNWIHSIDFSLQRGRKKYSKANHEKQEAFVEALKKTPKSAT